MNSSGFDCASKLFSSSDLPVLFYLILLCWGLIEGYVYYEREVMSGVVSERFDCCTPGAFGLLQ